MTDILLSTTETENSDDIQLIAVNIVTRNEDWLGRFDRLMIFRSTQGVGGPFEELTAAGWLPPRLPKSGGDEPSSPVTGPLVNIVDTELVLLVGKVQISITFTGVDPLTYTQVASQITDQGLSLCRGYVDAAGELVVETFYPGLVSSLEIVSSEAAILLGLPTLAPDNVAYGRDPRLALVADKTRYSLYDFFGSRAYSYRTQFIDTLTGAVSEPSLSQEAVRGLGLPTNDLILGYLQLVSGSGDAFAGAEVRVFFDVDATLVVGTAIASSSSIRKTDENGRAEFQLVRGHRITVSVPGTAIFRSIRVPTDPALTSFNLLDPTIAGDDVFKAVVPSIITAERRTL